ncbi:MAG: fumarate hydratase [Actinomycetota bacterium]|nr:fumarate hydratase [Actinomycetota bacterium]
MNGSRILHEDDIAAAVEALAVEASVDLPRDVEDALRRAEANESQARSRYALRMMLENALVARERGLPLCQDTGRFHLFVELGEGVSLPHGFQEAADRGLDVATRRVPLRSSVVDDPLFSRDHRGDNRPVLIHIDNGGPGERAQLTLLAKGGGSENATHLFMLLPGEGSEGLKRAVTLAVGEKAAQACPPVVVGIGAGADAERALCLALKSLLRPLGSRNDRSDLAALEEEMLRDINALGIGAAGLGGDTTALDVHLEEAPTHIACLPVGVVLCCHSLRRRTIEV